MENWLSTRQDSSFSHQAWDIIVEEIKTHFDDQLLVNPEATKGKKNKPKYSERQKNLAKSLLTYKPKGDNS